jgi:DNA repair exonuclease SbcCD ATPase subunit
MIEPIMYLAIGFLVSMLFGLMVLPLVHNRAVRLTTRRLEAATPISMAEIQADKDQLRAEFAMSARRLEMSVEQLKNKTTSQFADLGKKSDAINRMKLELGEKSATIFSLETREKTVRDQLRSTEEEFATKTESLRTAEAALSEKQSDLARLTNELADRSITADTRQVELLAVRTQVDALKNRVGDAEQDFASTRDKLESQRGESDTAARDLIAARGQVHTLTQRVGDLDRQLADQFSAATQLNQRVQQLEASLAVQAMLLADRDDENAKLKQAHESAVRIANDSREELAATGTGAAPALDRMRTEKTATEDQLRLMTEDRGRLQRELNAMQQQAESTWATERMENALLRERINDIAAEVAKLAMTLEGPNSTIEAMLAAAPATSLAPSDDMATGETRGTLADRIRALQAHASRAREAT